MQVLVDEVRSPLDVCIDQLQNSAGPPANSDLVVSLTVRLREDKTALSACAELILQDIGLTLRLLRTANSASFNPSGQPVTSVVHAAALLGTDALLEILRTAPRGRLKQPARELAALSQLTAVMARNLMSRTEPRFADDAFLCGLFRNVGELNFAVESPAEYQRIIDDSSGQLTGLRAACSRRLQFQFDELSAGLLFNWGFHGPPLLAAQSSADALYAQTGSAEADIALSAVLAHTIVTAHYRSDSIDRERAMRFCWDVLVKKFQMREAQVEHLCRMCLELAPPPGKLRLHDWMTPPPPLERKGGMPKPTVTSVLNRALTAGISRAAWLSLTDSRISLAASAGSNWPGEGPSELPRLIDHRKPPYLLAFGQKQDVWVDCTKDRRFRDSPLANALNPAAFFLLPVCNARRVRGCLYFDILEKPDFPPEKLLPGLVELRDFIATNMLGV